MRTIDHTSPGFGEVQSFTAPAPQKKGNEENEDFFGTIEVDGIVIQASLSDGATDKNGFRHEGHTGGWWASRFVVETCLETDAVGEELVAACTAQTRERYMRMNPQNIAGFAGATLLDVRYEKNGFGVWDMVITQVGDNGFRLWRKEGEPVLKYDRRRIDLYHGELRAAYVQKQIDTLKELHNRAPTAAEYEVIIATSREEIRGRLNDQYKFQNKADHALGFGVIDGNPVPPEFVKVTREPAKNILGLELFTDGYQKLPWIPSIEQTNVEWERQRELDPHSLGKHGYDPGTKIGDDRTIVILSQPSMP